MTEPEKKQAEQLKKQGDVKEALEQATPPPEAHEKPRKSLLAGLIVYALLIALFLGARIVLMRSTLGLPERTLDILQRASLGAVFIVLALLLGKAVQMYFLPRFDTVTRYNLRRILRLAIFLAIVIVVVSAVFVGWYTALVSLGVLSLILGLRAADADHELHRLDLHPGPQALPGRRSHPDRRRDGRRHRRELPRHDAVGVRRASTCRPTTRAGASSSSPTPTC